MKKPKFRHVLKGLIADRGITLRELSRETGVPQATLSAFLAGGSAHKPEHLLALAQYFGTSIEFLLFGEDQRPPTLEEIMTEPVFSGWLKVRIDRAIPDKRKVKAPDES